MIRNCQWNTSAFNAPLHYILFYCAEDITHAEIALEKVTQQAARELCL